MLIQYTTRSGDVSGFFIRSTMAGHNSLVSLVSIPALRRPLAITVAACSVWLKPWR